MKRTATLLAITGLALSSNVEGNFQDDELFAQIAARAGVWALTHPQQITKGVEVGLRSAPAVIGGVKKGYDWVRRHDDDELFAEGDDEFFVEGDQDNELFAQIAARAGVWALTHPQQITKGVEVGLRSAPAVIGGVKKGYDWVRRHDDADDEFFAQDQDDEFFAEGDQDNELFAQIAARAGVWALTHPQQITKGVEVGLRSAPAVIGGVKKGYDWVRRHDDADDEFFAEDDEFYGEEDNELFAQIAARAGVWALTHPQQITKGVEVGLRSAPAVIGGVKKGYDWVRRHDDADDELFAEKHTEMKPKKTGQKLRGNHRVEAEKPDLAQLGDLIKEGRKL